MEKLPPASSILRVLYVCVFWLVLLTVHVVWPQAGGQTHLDIMAWPWKLFLPLALAFSVAGMTAAAAEGESFWNGKVLKWLVVIVALALAIAVVTYYYHLHENDNLEEAVPEETAFTRIISG
ncbi:MAG: hypothetical protein JST65_14955 [Acidobacteria bacterium]|nr:hypothetical protein [Acidobacteriota bacterium]